MELVDQRFFCSAFACGSIGGGMDTAGFAVIFLPSSGSQAIFLDVGAATFLATQHMHYPYRTETLQQYVLYHYLRTSLPLRYGLAACAWQSTACRAVPAARRCEPLSGVGARGNILAQGIWTTICPGIV